MGVVCQMITVHHESWVATLEISFPETWQQKSDFYSSNNFYLILGMLILRIENITQWLRIWRGLYSESVATSPPCPARTSEACHPLGLPLLPQLPLKPPPSSGQQILPLEKFILILSWILSFVVGKYANDCFALTYITNCISPWPGAH